MYIRSFTKIMDDAADIVYMKKGEMMLSNFLMAIVLSGAVVVGTIALGIVGIFSAIAHFSVLSILGVIVLAIFVMAVIAAAEGSIALLTDCYYHGEQAAGATYTVGKCIKRLPALMGYICLEAIGLIPLIIILGIGFGILGYSIDNLETKLLFMSAYPTGVVFLVAVGILIVVAIVILLLAIYNTFFAFGIPAIVVDGLGPIEAFKKNYNLVKDEFMSVVKKMILIKIGTIGISLCFSMALGLIGLVLGLGSVFSTSLDMTSVQVISVLIEWPVRLIFNLLFFAVNPAVITVFYYNQKCRKEGADLGKRLSYLKKKNKEQSEAVAYEKSGIDLIKKQLFEEDIPEINNR